MCATDFVIKKQDNIHYKQEEFCNGKQINNIDLFFFFFVMKILNGNSFLCGYHKELNSYFIINKHYD